MILVSRSAMDFQARLHALLANVLRIEAWKMRLMRDRDALHDAQPVTEREQEQLRAIDEGLIVINRESDMLLSVVSKIS